MMMVRSVSEAPSIAPLLEWKDERDIEMLHVKRKALAERIERLPRMSHRRILLEAQLQGLTFDQLSLEVNRGKPS